MKTHLKAGILILVLAASSVSAWIWFKNSRPNPQLQEINLLDKMEKVGVPHFKLEHLDGTEFDLNSVKGKILIINFWASWCDPCVREFPSMLKLVEHFKGEVKLIAVSNDSSKEDIEVFVKAFEGNKENVELLWDKDFKVRESFGTNKLPESYLVGRDLKLIRKIIGIEEWYNESAIEYMQTLVDRKN